MPYNFFADGFTQKNFVADFLQAKCDFTLKTAVLWGLEVTYDVYLRLVGKSIEYFLLMLIELFFARCYG